MTKFEEFGGKVKTKYLAFRDKMGRVADGIKAWAKENPEEAAGAVCSIVFVGGGTVLSAVKKHKKEKEAYDERECRQWDPVSGQYYYTKRGLKNNEKLEMERRMMNGERKGEILRDMKLI